MYDLKTLNNGDEFINEENTPSNSKSSSHLVDRSYYGPQLTSTLLYTRSSYVPKEGLF